MPPCRPLWEDAATAAWRAGDRAGPSRRRYDDWLGARRRGALASRGWKEVPHAAANNESRHGQDQEHRGAGADQRPDDPAGHG